MERNIAMLWMLAAALFPAGAGAQTAVVPPEPDSFASLQAAAKPGARLRIVDWSGRSTTGRLDALSPSAVRLAADGVSREMPREGIAGIRRNGDSLWNGIAWGGAVAGALFLRYNGDCDNCYSAAELASARLAAAGIGAGLGAWLDLMIRDQRVLYQAPGGAPLVERAGDGWVVAPDFKVSTVNGSAASLAGGYAGRVIDNAFLVGAGAYGLTSGRDRLRMQYLGIVLGWQPPPRGRFGVHARALLGAGSHASWYSGPTWEPFVSSGLLVVEPQVDLAWKLTDRLGLGTGLGYRLTAFDEDDRLRGLTASVALRFGAGF